METFIVIITVLWLVMLLVTIVFNFYYQQSLMAYLKKMHYCTWIELTTIRSIWGWNRTKNFEFAMSLDNLYDPVVGKLKKKVQYAFAAILCHFILANCLIGCCIVYIIRKKVVGF
ncbi:MAG: hypothetical protein ABFD91_17865 [Anaerohalosphaeraceae bacterium]